MSAEKKAIVLVNFGVSYPETRTKTIDALAHMVQEHYPDYTVVTAFTSEMIRRKLKARGDVVPPNTHLALKALGEEGYTHVYVQPTHLIAGFEYEKMLRQLNQHRASFTRVKVGNPLLAHPEDYEAVAKIMDQAYARPDDVALVLMGHGTEHFMNAAYPALGYEFERQGIKNAFVGTVEGYPDIRDIIDKLGETAYKKCILAPLLFVAGDHAQNDMAGDEEDSWKSLLTREGYEVEAQVQGMGEIPGIQELYFKHLESILG